jgi:hypothetical protein
MTGKVAEEKKDKKAGGRYRRAKRKGTETQKENMIKNNRLFRGLCVSALKNNLLPDHKN